MSIAANKQTREEVEALIDLADTQPPRYWEEVIRQASAKLPPKPLPSPAAMNDAQAAKFERQEMPFGKHAGELVRDVPPGYLLWLTENESNFLQALRLYLASERFQRRQE